MEPRAYLHLQLRLEGKEVINEGLLKQVEIVPEEEVPLMLIAQLARQELMVYYDEAISSNLQTELAACLHDVQFPSIDSVLDILKNHKIRYEIGHYKTYVFPSAPQKERDVLCLSKDDRRVKTFGFDSFAERVYAIEDGGNLVSACVSTHENKKCGEAWVYTAPEYRGHGFAQKVVKAWAGSLMEAGKVPFYSHKLANEASATLARRLGLEPVFEEIVITQVQGQQAYNPQKD